MIRVKQQYHSSRASASDRALTGDSRMGALTLFAYTLLGFSICSSVLGQPLSKRPLTVGIDRNQRELQRIADMIDENRKEQSWILAGAWADAASIVTAGGLKHVDDAERAADFLKTLKEAAGAAGKLTDIRDAMEDFKGNDLGLKVSDSLKELLDLLSVNPALAELGTANNVVDLGIKASQWRALQVENDELLKVLVQLKRAQDQLLAKDPVTRAKIEAAARKATQEAEQRQRVQSDLLRDYYKDKPQTIELAVRGASKRSAQAAMQVASGLQIAGRAQNAFDLSKIPGINPDAIAAINRCNSIAASMMQRQANLTAIRNRCPKPEKPGGDAALSRIRSSGSPE